MTTITQISKPVPAPFALGLRAIAGIVVNRAKLFVRAFKHRHDAAILVGLDDRMLADIGLTRGDLRDAFSQPLWCDPTTVLTDRAGERRAHRHRAGLAGAHRVAAPSIVPALSTGTQLRGRAARNAL